MSHCSLLMQPESSPGDEPPSLSWGLDPVFVAFAKLYIRDILAMKESCQVPGVFFYNGHPIKQVDILGTVVEMREKDSFCSYGVDDSTGVINCICWKKSSDTEPSPAVPHSAREWNALPKLEKLQEAIKQRTRIDIGDVIQVRGYIRTYREEREVHAAMYYKVDDPVWSIQMARMLELPDLYRKVYDQPSRCAALELEEASSNPGAQDITSLTRLLSEKVKEFLLKEKVQTFYQQELEAVASLLSLASQPVSCGTCSDQVEFKTHTSSKAIHSVFRNAIELLRAEGLVFRKSGGFADLYHVTREDKGLHRKILQIIQEDCRKPNHRERGCHFQHILACARLSVQPGLSEAVLQQVLELLEDQSDIFGTTDRYYVAF